MLKSPTTPHGDSWAECHRRSPRLIVFEEELLSAYPTTTPDSWCGEYEVNLNPEKGPSHAAVEALGKNKPPKPSKEAAAVSFVVGPITEQSPSDSSNKLPKGKP
jgi:hypothetical protein